MISINSVLQVSSTTWKWEELTFGGEEAGDKMLWGCTGEGGGGGLVWGWIGVFLRVFSCRELLFYRAVVRLHSWVLGRDGVSWHGGDWWWIVMVQGLGMGKAINGLCLHGYMLNLVWVELEGVQVGSGGQLHSSGCKRYKGCKRGCRA